MGRKQLKYIELDDEEGRLYAAGEPHLLFPISTVEFMRGIFRKIAGDAAAEALMYRIGEEIGRGYAKRVKRILEASKVELDKDALLVQAYCTAMQSGWGGIKKIKWANREKNKIEIQGRNFPCLELEGCSCALERGILAGAYREIVGGSIYFALTSKTGAEVVFNSLEETPPDVLKAEELALLSKSELEEVIREKTYELEKARIATLNIVEDIAKAKKELQESEEKLRAIVESAKDSIFVKDRKLRYVMVNPAMERLFELPAEKLLGKSDAELFGKEAGHHIEEVDSRVLQGETVEDVHSETVGDEKKTFHTVKVPLRDASGKISGLCGIARDITEQKKAEERERRIAELDKIYGEITDIFLKEWRIETGAKLMLEKIGKFMGVCRSYIIHYSEDGKHMSNVYEWCAEGIPSQIDNLQQIPVEAVPYWNKELSQNHVIQTSDIKTLPQAERDILEPQGIKSILAVPIFVNKKLFGFVGFDEVRYHREWHHEEIATLRGIADAYASVMERIRAEEELQKYNAKLERFNRLAVNRELKMIELKREVNRLYERLGEKPRYDLSFVDDKKLQMKNYEIEEEKNENEKEL